jgi:hypothetical protein
VIDRRTFLAGTGAVLLAAPLAAEAQQARKVPHIGVLQAGAHLSRSWRTFGRGCGISETSRDETSFLNFDAVWTQDSFFRITFALTIVVLPW